ncbi:MAG TPA: F0F1 ATP synthase subunit epsilon [Candidatus Acidoferrales bacterium]|nr:F0F1 ATP synthase subunit epsilon [Candidatus Acidoferrales bacterium]
MLPDKIELEVVTPQRLVLHEDVESVELPGRDGYLGVLPGHAPLLTELGIGVLTYRANGQGHVLTVMEGFSEVLPDRVIVLAEVSERAAEIDVERSRAALQRAQELVAKTGSPDIDWKRAQSALQRAMVRIQVGSKAGN